MQCASITKTGQRCKNKVTPPETCCYRHKAVCPLPGHMTMTLARPIMVKQYPPILPLPTPVRPTSPIPVYRPASPKAIVMMPKVPNVPVLAVKNVLPIDIARMPKVPQVAPKIMMMPEVPKFKPAYGKGGKPKK